MSGENNLSNQLDRSIYQTIRYFSLLDSPVTATQVWQNLVVEKGDPKIRWSGQSAPSLVKVRERLEESEWLKKKIESKWGYYFLHGEEDSVERRLHRHVLAAHKWKITRRVARLMAPFPFVRMIAGSGSLAQANTRPESDLDLFVVAHNKRIWTARLFLLMASQLTGRRRKHWDVKAPDKICLNHYVTDDSLLISRDIRNMYTAVLYSHLVALYGESLCQEFIKTNETWIKRFIMYQDLPILSHRHKLEIWPVLLSIKKVVEAVLLEPVGDVIERGAEKLQRRFISLHTRPGRGGRIVLSDSELAFHPDSRASWILQQFDQEEGQGRLI